jgi:hypothetical protein
LALSPPTAEVVANAKVFFVGVITPFASCEIVSINAFVVEEAAGLLTGVCLTL